MIEEFPFTTRVLQTEKDIHSLKAFIEQSVKEAKERLALLTWARLTWEQRVTLHTNIAVHANQIATDEVITYHLANTSSKKYRLPIVCETLSQMQF